MKVLGLDLGNAKVKPCFVNFQESLAHSRIAWDCFELPFTANRAEDFATGIPWQIQFFLALQQVESGELDCVVACSSHSYSYPVFHQSIRHLASILQQLFDPVPVYLIAADGTLLPAAAVAALSERQCYAYVLTNFYGSAYLGSKLIRNGLSIDIGTTTTDIIPIREGCIDPAGLVQPEDYLAFRYRQHRIDWLGLTATPLCALTDRVEAGGHVYQTVPRDYRTDLIFALLEQKDAVLLRQHAYFGNFPDPQAARERLAQFVGLDPYLLSGQEIEAIANFLYQLMIERATAGIQHVVRHSFSQPLEQLEVAVFALGERLLALPALKRAGFQEPQLHFLELQRENYLWSASSALAMAIKGLEHLLGQSLPLPGAR